MTPAPAVIDCHVHIWEAERPDRPHDPQGRRRQLRVGRNRLCQRETPRLKSIPIHGDSRVCGGARSNADGWDGYRVGLGNMGITSLEILETENPIRTVAFELADGWGGRRISRRDSGASRLRTVRPRHSNDHSGKIAGRALWTLRRITRSCSGVCAQSRHLRRAEIVFEDSTDGIGGRDDDLHHVGGRGRFRYPGLERVKRGRESFKELSGGRGRRMLD